MKAVLIKRISVSIIVFLSGFLLSNSTHHHPPQYSPQYPPRLPSLLLNDSLSQPPPVYSPEMLPPYSPRSRVNHHELSVFVPSFDTEISASRYREPFLLMGSRRRDDCSTFCIGFIMIIIILVVVKQPQNNTVP